MVSTACGLVFFAVKNSFARALVAAVTVTLVLAGAGVPAVNAQSAVPSMAPTASVEQLSAGARWASSHPGDSGIHNANDAFYIPPSQIPQQPGAVIRTKPAPHLLNVLGPEFPGYAQKILYTSTKQNGDKVAVSGFVIEPSVKWDGPGPTPTLAFAPGTRGQADACAPSRGVGLAGQFDPASGALGLNYEIPMYQAAAAQGMRVVVTDYIGLGTPGVHTYLNRIEQAHALIDAARAALNVSRAPEGAPVGFFGYSQGGGAAASAAELVARYGSELNVVGTYAGAPPAHPTQVLQAVDGGNIMAVLGYAINSFIESDPDRAKPVFDRVLNARGQAFLEDTKHSCLADAALRWAGTETSALTKSGLSLHDVAMRDPEVRAIFNEHRVGNNAPISAPIRAAISVNDDVIPHGQAVQMAADMCAAGGAVQLVSIQQPPILPGSGGNHVVPYLTDAVPALGYIADRFLGKPAPNTCTR